MFLILNNKRKIEQKTILSHTFLTFRVSLELNISYNTSVNNSLELSGRIDEHESFKSLKSKETSCDNNNGAINKRF